MTIASLEVAFSTGTLQTFLPQDAVPLPQLYQAKWDHEISEAVATRYGITSFNDRGNGLPMIFRPAPFNKSLLTESLQNLWYANIVREGAGLSVDQLHQAWRWMTDHNRAYTNGVGPDILRDYILQERMDLELPGIFPLITGGGVYAGNETTYQGIRQLEVEHIPHNYQYTPGDVAIFRNHFPWLIAYAVNSTKNKLTNDPSMPYGGDYLVNPWTTELWQGRNAPVPLIAREAIYYPLELLKKLPLGSPVPSPYNPPRP